MRSFPISRPADPTQREPWVLVGGELQTGEKSEISKAIESELGEEVHDLPPFVRIGTFRRGETPDRANDVEIDVQGSEGAIQPTRGQSGFDEYGGGERGRDDPRRASRRATEKARENQPTAKEARDPAQMDLFTAGATDRFDVPPETDEQRQRRRDQRDRDDTNDSPGRQGGLADWTADRERTSEEMADRGLGPDAADGISNDRDTDTDTGRPPAQRELGQRGLDQITDADIERQADRITELERALEQFGVGFEYADRDRDEAVEFPNEIGPGWKLLDFRGNRTPETIGGMEVKQGNYGIVAYWSESSHMFVKIDAPVASRSWSGGGPEYKAYAQDDRVSGGGPTRKGLIAEDESLQTVLQRVASYLAGTDVYGNPTPPWFPGVIAKQADAADFSRIWITQRKTEVVMRYPIHSSNRDLLVEYDSLGADNFSLRAWVTPDGATKNNTNTVRVPDEMIRSLGPVGSSVVAIAERANRLVEKMNELAYDGELFDTLGIEDDLTTGYGGADE